jgi:hypothetical protein
MLHMYSWNTGHYAIFPDPLPPSHGKLVGLRQLGGFNPIATARAQSSQSSWIDRYPDKRDEWQCVKNIIVIKLSYYRHLKSDMVIYSYVNITILSQNTFTI